MKNVDFDTTERTAAAALGLNFPTLRRWRLAGKIPDFCYVKHGYKCVRYCLPLLQDWQLAPDDLEAQGRAIALLESQRRIINPPESPSIQNEPKIKNHDQCSSNSDISTGSDELPRFCWGATNIQNAKSSPPENLWDVCLTDPVDLDEVVIELARSDRVPP